MEIQDHGPGYHNYTRLLILFGNEGVPLLRLMFKRRYKTLMGTAWQNKSTDLIRLGLSPENESTTLNLSPEQRVLIEKADIHKWDFSLLIKVLLSIDYTKAGPWFSNREALKREAENENEALIVLRGIRNFMEHQPHPSIPDVEFNKVWNKAKMAFIQCGFEEKELERIRTSRMLQGIVYPTTEINNEAMEKANSLRKQGDQLVASLDFEQGISKYSQALILCGLSEEEKLTLYSQRCEAYLSALETNLPEDTREVYIESALTDAKATIEASPKSSNGYFLAGKLYHILKQWDRAIDYFDHGLSLNPGSQETTTSRDECRYDQSDEEILIHLDPKGSHVVGYIESMQRFIKERFSDANNHYDLQEARQEIAEMLKLVDSKEAEADLQVLAFTCAALGQLYQFGDEVPRNLEKAFELYKRAADLGRQDGKLQLAYMYIHGLGVKRNLAAGVKLIEEVAADLNRNKSPTQNIYVLTEKKSVAKAKFVMGRLYQAGICKPRNDQVAAAWFDLASKEGCCLATTNLSVMHANGIGVSQDRKRAIQYQRLAIEQGCGPVGMFSLSGYYLTAGNLARAQYWYNRSIELGFTLSILNKSRFDEHVQELSEQCEKFKQLLPDHIQNSTVPIHVLFHRYLKRFSPEFNEMHQELERTRHPKTQASFTVFDKDFDLNIVREYAAMGRKYAQMFLLGFEHFCYGLNSIISLVKLDKIKEQQRSDSAKLFLKKEALKRMSACYTSGLGYIASMRPNCHQKLLDVTKEFISDSERSEMDLHARICRLYLLFTSFKEALKFAEACKSLYPKEPYFYYIETNLFGFLKRHEEGFRVAEEGLKLFPHYWELLFDRAEHLLGIVVSSEAEDRNSVLSGQIQAYQEFIDKAPADHRKIPESYYWIANLYGHKGMTDKAKENYLLGLKSEELLLPVFLPCDLTPKKMIEQKLKLISAIETDELSTKNDALKALEGLLDKDPVEIEENRQIQVKNPKRIATVRECRRRFAWWEANRRMLEIYLPLGGTLHANILPGKHLQRAPSPEKIPLLKEIRFEDMDPTIDRIYEGYRISLTVMEECVDSNFNSVCTVVKDDNHDCQIIWFHGFDPKDPATKRKLGFGSRIQLMNPYLRLPASNTVAVIRVDDPESVIFISNGDNNRMCRYCWKPNPVLRCSKCKSSKYCDQECQRLDCKDLDHKIVCNIICPKKTKAILWHVALLRELFSYL